MGGQPASTEDLFQQILDTPRPARAIVLDVASGGDEELARRVMRLIDAYEREGEDHAERAPHLPPEHEPAPVRVGRYVIESMVAEGGMSVVYRARQEQPRRLIALKVIRPHLTSVGAMSRFTLETQVLGMLQDPCIAQIYDAGTAEAEFEDGRTELRSFLAMELVDGAPVTIHAKEQGLGVAACVGLVADICEAVHSAHQHGVIHRDLKPANILVTRSSRPKVLDFGAACLASELVSAVATSEAHIVVGTGPYLSPEHVCGDLREIDTRSDVYSLGVILYELLTGRTPFEVDGVPLPEAARRIRSGERTPILTAAPRIPRDLALVVERAMASSKLHRYQSAADFGADLRRFLRREPVLAHAPGTLYELRMLAVRRPRLLSLAGLALLAVMVAAVLAVYQASVATREARAKGAALADAAAARDEAEASADFLENILIAANPDQAGRDVRLRDLLDGAAGKIEGSFAGKPSSESRAREAIGRTYMGLGRLEEARVQLERAYELRRTSLGEEHPTTARCGMALAAALGVIGRSEESHALYAKALDVFRREYPDGNRLTIDAMLGLASVEKDRQNFPEALRLFREAVALARAGGGPLSGADMHAMATYADALHWTGSTPEAQALYDEIVGPMRASLGEDHPWTLQAQSGAAAVDANMGRLAEAEELYRAVYASRTRVLGPEHGDTLGAANNLAGVLLRAGRLDEARELYEQVIAGAEKTLGPDHRNTLKSRFNLAQVHVFAGRTVEARALLTSILAAQRATLGPAHVDIADSLQLLGGIAAMDDDQGEAESLFHEAIGMLTELLDPSHPFILKLRFQRGQCLDALARFTEAEEELVQAAQGLLARGPALAERARAAVEELAACYEAQGRHADAERARAMIVDAAR